MGTWFLKVWSYNSNCGQIIRIDLVALFYRTFLIWSITLLIKFQ